MSLRRGAALFLVMTCVGTSCGGGGKQHQAAATSTPAGPTTMASADVSGQAGASSGAPTTAPTGAAATGPSGSIGATTTAKPTIPVTVTVDKACTHPGDTQGITVRTVPKADIIFDAVYDNTTDESIGKLSKGGSGHGTPDANGVFRTTWVLGPKVPAGPAVVKVGASYGSIGKASAPFVVKNAGVKCC
jgi:hypothetical protein